MRKLSRVIEQTADQVIITDKDGLIEYVNPAFEELTGYTRAEAIGQTPRILKSGGHKPEYYQTFWDTILSGRVLRSVVINKKKNGELFYEEKTITPLKDGEGSITHFVSTGKDITKAKQLEEQLAAIYQLGQDLALLRDEATIAQRVLETATNVLRFEIACWGLVNQADSELEYRYRLVNGAVQAISHRLPLMTGREPEDIGAAVVRTGQLLNVPDVTSELYCAPLPEDWSSCSALCVPMKVGERVIGILNTESAEPNHFTAGDERLLQTLANQSAVALENARLHAETQRWANELSVLNRAGRVMASSLDMNTVLAQTLAEIKEVLHAEGASILRYTPGSDELVFVAAVGPNTQKILGTTVPIAASVAGRSLLEEQPILVEDTQQDFRFYNQIDVQTGMTTHSLLAVPLIFRENVIGVIEVMNKGQGVFNLHDLEILEAMTNSAAIAIKNAQLYETEREQYRRLQQSQTQLIQVEKLAAIGRLVGSIAHEVNNPVQAIQNCLTLSKEELAEQQRLDKVNFYIDIAKTELDRIANIIRRMRDFYHPARPGPAGYAPESDTIEQFYQLAPEELQVIEVHDILESVLQLANKQLQHSLVRVKNFWAENLPAIEGSSDHLKQVFLNLVLNAIDAMSPTGGVLTIRTRVDKVESPDGKPYPVVRLEFSDTGPGISPENQSRLFEPLFTTKAHGSGFGLFTSHKIIEAHCGQISVASQVGQGTTFTILLSVTHNPTYDPQN
jgi:two-component system NtrC family sensor kinase